MSELERKLEDYGTMKAAIADLEAEIFELMRADLVQEASAGNVTATLKESPVWDEQTLDMLREYINEDVYRNKPSVPTWNKVKLKKLAKKGGDVAKIVMQAQQNVEKFSIRVKK